MSSRDALPPAALTAATKSRMHMVPSTPTCASRATRVCRLMHKSPVSLLIWRHSCTSAGEQSATELVVPNLRGRSQNCKNMGPASGTSDRLRFMNDQQRQAVKEAIERQTAANTASPSAARDALVRMGLYTTDGKVAPEYGPSKMRDLRPRT